MFNLSQIRKMRRFFATGQHNILFFDNKNMDIEQHRSGYNSNRMHSIDIAHVMHKYSRSQNPDPKKFVDWFNRIFKLNKDNLHYAVLCDNGIVASTAATTILNREIYKDRIYLSTRYEHHTSMENHYSCIHCGEYARNADGIRAGSHNRICKKCKDRGDYSKCDYNSRIAGEKVYCVERRRDRPCSNCRLNPVNNYSRNVLGFYDGFLRTPGEGKDPKKTDIYLGVELEFYYNRANRYTPTGRSNAEQVNTMFSTLDSEKFAILKHDASLREYGSEIVSVPATLAYHKSGVWERIMQRNEGQVLGWDGYQAGMHVHISRAPFTPEEVGKMLVFVNSPANRELIEYIAGRQETRYAAFTNKTVDDGSRETTLHRDALSLSAKNTLELRIFRSNVNPAAIIKNVEFTHAMAMFCKQASEKELNMDKFLEYIVHNKKLYPNLLSYLSVVKKVDEKFYNKKFAAEICA